MEIISTVSSTPEAVRVVFGHSLCPFSLWVLPNQGLALQRFLDRPWLFFLPAVSVLLPRDPAPSVAAGLDAGVNLLRFGFYRVCLGHLDFVNLGLVGSGLFVGVMSDPFFRRPICVPSGHAR